jgi:glycosyltransferase involved in cell wall biosynthesis
MNSRKGFDNSAGQAGARPSYASWHDRQLAVFLARTNRLLRKLEISRSPMERSASLARELATATALLEARNGELRRLVERESAHKSEIGYWQSKAAALEEELKRWTKEEAGLRAEERRLQEEVSRLAEAEKSYASENRLITSRAHTTARDAAALRGTIDELRNSLSWKITAPLRVVSGPLFRVLARAQKKTPEKAQAEFVHIAAAGQTAAVAGGTLSSTPATADRLARLAESVLPALRRAESLVVIPCAIPFSATLNQRPMSCARYFADHGTTVLYVAWQWSPDEVVPQEGEEVYQRVFCLPLYAFQNHVDRIAPASPVKSTYICTLASPGLTSAVRPLRAAGFHIHYDIMDDWEEFHRGGEAPWFSADIERELVFAADTVTAVSEKLAQKFASLRDIVVLRNGYHPAALSCEQFAAARMPLANPKTIGYFGHLSDAWFDWDTVIHAAQKLPAVEFELIGWGASERTLARVNSVPNIRLAGIVPQGELHHYVRRWWAGIIPFRASRLSAAVDPLKIYEYLHFGLPTVVTGISGIAGYPLVEFAEDAGSFVSALENTSSRPDEQSLARVGEFLRACVWDERFAALKRMVTQSAAMPFLYRR